MNKKYDLMSQDCEGGDKYALTSGTFKECEDYQKKDEVEQEKLGICVDYEIREQ
jgi:hypothetical protein